MPDLIIAGAGLFGLTIAERAASSGFSVRIIEERDKIGGNSASHIDDETGVEVHTYGSHIFHTSNAKVWEYVNRFTPFNPYTHRGRTVTASGKVIPLPFSLASYSALFDEAFTPEMVRRLLIDSDSDDMRNFEDTAIDCIGRDLYEAVVKGYTIKQWGRDPKELPASIIKRLPIRYTWDDNYFSDTYQGIPSHGYQFWFDRMLDNSNIEVQFSESVTEVPDVPLVHTGPIDTFFKYKHGQLGWRSVDMVPEWHADDFQGCAIMNYADEKVPWTRIHEYKHYRPDRDTRGSIIHREYSRETQLGEVGAYPVNTAEDHTMLKKYRRDAKRLSGVWFGGRLGSYKYLDMHMAIASALTMWRNEIKPYLETS